MPARAERADLLARLRETEWVIPVLLLLAGLALYTSTLAPTVVWGDDALLQIAAVAGKLQASAGSHPAWVAVAHFFTRLPLGETAYRVNLVSAVSAAVALPLMYRLQRLLEISPVGAMLAVASYAVSHTFWAHAVRPEVYAMTVATSTALVVCALEWWQSAKVWQLGLIGLTFGLAFLTHVLVLLYLPALIWLLIMHRTKLSVRGWAFLLGGTFVGMIPLFMLLARDARSYAMGPGALLRWTLFTYTGHDFSGQFLRFSAQTVRADASQWALYLGYQFVGLALILGLAGLAASWRRLPRSLWFFVLLLYLVPALFAFSYQVGDRFVFFLPSYLAVTIWIGFGADAIVDTWSRFVAAPAIRRLLIAGLLALLVALPVVVYRLTPDVMEEFGIRFRDDRRVPGPNGRYFLLWPPKNGYYDARVFAEGALAAVQPNGIMLADPILAAPMRFLQQMEGVRLDVSVHDCCQDAPEVLATSGERSVALADVTPDIYPIALLQQEYEIVPAPPIYMLTRRQ
jgi:hypothetical protein